METEPTPIRAILIAGPTASGKSALALALAERFSGWIVNADAIQVYGDLRVLSARPSGEDAAKAPHCLYGHVDAAEAYGVGRWLEDAGRIINSLSTADETASQQFFHIGARSTAPGGLPIFVGGTGLYFDALTRGLASVPAIPEEIRTRWRSFDPSGLHAEMARRDPVMATRLRPSDPQRLMRALEVIDATGRSLAEWQKDETDQVLDPGATLRIVLSPDRAALDARIVRRLEMMIADGAADEAAALSGRGLDPALPAMKALGVVPLSAWKRGDISREEAFERTRLDTRRYAKRQSTWFRNRMADWLHVDSEKALEVAEREAEHRGIGV